MTIAYSVIVVGRVKKGRGLGIFVGRFVGEGSAACQFGRAKWAIR